MMTVMTEVTLRSGHESHWDRVYRERAADAQRQDGWLDLQLLIPENEPRKRIVVGTWRDREAWERWHASEGFERTRRGLDAATEQHGDDRWFVVVEHEASTVHSPGDAGALDAGRDLDEGSPEIYRADHASASSPQPGPTGGQGDS
jgi:heme-degrading monooxygenase HmoA